MNDFEIVTIEQLEEIIMGLPRKKGMDEEITSDILKAAWQVIKEEFVVVINSSLKEGCCPNGWKTSTIILIPKIEKTEKQVNIGPLICYQYLKKY